MTLLELLRQELPKRGGWPEGVTAMFQDWDGEVRFRGKSGSIYLTTVADNHRKDDQIEKSDYEHCVVTREQYGWDGTGLPPVGVECEIKFLKYTPPAEWFSFKLIEVHDEIVIITLNGENKWQHISKLSPDKVTFRPLRTEAERAIDEMVQLSGVSTGAAKILYDAGYRKG